MARLPLTRASCLLLALLLSASPALLAAGDRHGHPTAKLAASSFVSRALAGLVSLFAHNGSEMDPNGRHLLGDNGSTMDPNGRHLPGAVATGDNGSTMDPDGKK